MVVELSKAYIVIVKVLKLYVYHLSVYASSDGLVYAIRRCIDVYLKEQTIIFRIYIFLNFDKFKRVLVC
jgi:hypothetical protein